MIYWFQDISAQDIEIVGGKGANLGEMTKAGCNVPPGFCLSSKAYQEHILAGHLWEKIETLLNDKNGADIKSLAGISENIKTLIIKQPMNDSIREELSGAYKKLTDDGYACVAVRSSATAEDLPEASFAGQQETFLNIASLEDLYSAAKKCWASLWSPRSISYRQHNNFDHKAVSLSVVVQGMISAEVSGVLFTVNPLNNNRGEMLVNATYGLGEALVSGTVTPDSFCLKKSGVSFVKEKKIGSKEVMIVQRPGGNTIEEETPVEKREQFCIDEPELKELLTLGKTLEKYYNAPQDIEWALAGGEIFLLQTRPITTLTEETEKKISPKKYCFVKRKILDNILEHCPDPPFPLDYEAIMGLQESKHGIYRTLGLKIRHAKHVLKMDERGIPAVIPLVPLPTLKILGIGKTIHRLLKENANHSFAAREVAAEKELQKLQAVDLSQMDKKALAEYLKMVFENAMEWGKIRFNHYITPMIFISKKFQKLVSRYYKEKTIHPYMFLGDLDYESMIVDNALHDMAARIYRHPAWKETLSRLNYSEAMTAAQSSEAGREFLADWQQFLEAHGTRTMKAYLPFSNVSWKENPEAFFSTLKIVLKDSPEDLAQYAQAASERYTVLINSVTSSIPEKARSLFEQLLAQLRFSFKGREMTLVKIEHAFFLARQGVSRAARLLGYEDSKDLLFLRFTELCEGLNGGLSNEKLKELISFRRIHRKEAIRTWESFEPDQEVSGSSVIQGLAGSGGKVKGPAKIITGPDEFGKLESGDILVCSFTDPAWTPLFTIAAAVVADTGGPLSHAAIVAREYNIPAVLGTQVATKKIADGHFITVDGDKGKVILE